MRTQTYSLQQFLEEARRGAFVIPRFQRDFVWNMGQVKLLIDSIARNYPIGSLLLLQETDPADPFLAKRSVAAEIRGEPNDSEDEPRNEQDHSAATAMYYVLDGQQRLTSLVRVFLQADPQMNYYFDLRKLREFAEGETKWIVGRKVTAKVATRYLRSNSVTESENCQVLVEEYFEQHESELAESRDAQRRASAKVNGIFEKVRNYQIPVVIIDRTDSIEAICRIFETINSTGTKLTTFDLAVARFFPNPDLHSLLTKSFEELPTLKKFDVDGERILQVIALLLANNPGYVEVTRSRLLKLPGKEIAKTWDEASVALDRAYKWIEQRGGTPRFLPDERMLVPLAFFLAVVDDSWKHTTPGYGTVLERWFFANALQQGVKASNYRIALAARDLRQWLSDGKTPTIPSVELEANTLLGLRRSDNRYRAIHAVLMWKGGTDLWTEEVLDAESVEDHHIFPAAVAKREDVAKNQLDSIANRLLVSKETNRKLKDRMPHDYMGKLLREAAKQNTIESKYEQLRAACLPTRDSAEEFGQLFEQTRVSDFLKERASLIVERLRLLLGDALQHPGLLTESDE